MKAILPNMMHNQHVHTYPEISVAQICAYVCSSPESESSTWASDSRTVVQQCTYISAEKYNQVRSYYVSTIN